MTDFNVSSLDVLFNITYGQEATFTISITDDVVYEPEDSSIAMSIWIGSFAEKLGVTIGENSTAIVSIIDNDSMLVIMHKITIV